MVYLTYTFMLLGMCLMGTVLVYTEHYAWAWIPFLISGCVSFETKKCVCKEDK